MKAHIRRILAITVTAVILMTLAIPTATLGASASPDSKTVIKLSSGSGKMDVDGTILSIQKPYISGGIFYIPLRQVLEALGADVVMTGSGKVNVTFMDDSVDLAIGKKSISENQATKTLSAPPVIKDKNVMVPLTMLSQCFSEIKVTGGTVKSPAVITLENDGSLSDLSFLTGSLTKLNMGNSYFGWSMAVLKGSRIISQSFSSKSIQVENDQHGVFIDISADVRDGKTLAQYYSEIKKDPFSVLKADLIDSFINEKAAPAYIDLFYTDTYDEAIYERIYANDTYFYSITITSFDESDPAILKADKSITGLLNSFKLGYKGGLSDTADISSVKFGFAGYNNYVTSDTTGKKYPTWEMKILPDWDIMQQGADPYKVQFGTGLKENMTVGISHEKGLTSVSDYGAKMKSFYLKNFNPAQFTMVNAGASKVAGIDAYTLVYDAKIGKTRYRYNERYLIADGLLYDITMKVKSDSYQKRLDSFNKMLDTFAPNSKPSTDLITEMDRYQFNQDKNKVGKDEQPVSYENGKYGWSFTIPGNWQKNSAPGLSMESFFNSGSGAVVSIESISKDTSGNVPPDDERFDSMKMLAGKDLKPIKTDTVQVEGKNVKVYKYRLDEEDTENHADVYYYVIDGESHTYCFMSTIPDLTSSDSNLKTLAGIWDSFKINDTASADSTDSSGDTADGESNEGN